MSLLEELKKQAQEKSTQHVQGDSVTLQKNEQNWRILAPKMLLIFNYLKELAENLNILKSEDRFSYSLTKTIEFKNFRKQEFRIAKEGKDAMRSFSLRYDLAGDRDIQVIITNIAEAEKIRNLLSGRAIRFVDNIENQSRIVFMVKPKICVQFNYIADVENFLILLKIDNFDSAWSQTLRYSPELITNTLMDETAKYILNKPNKFQEISGNALSDEMRAKLREKLNKKVPIENKPEKKLEITANKLKSLFKR